MGLRFPPAMGRLLYAMLFTVALPAALVAWAAASAANVRLVPVHAELAGYAVGALGLAMVALGATTLTLYGEGLPMNPYPPARLVARGVYRLLAHPIYVGFGLACAGAALAAPSASGLWLVTPAVALGAAALWWGYERPDLLRRLGLPPTPLLGITPATDAPARPLRRLATGPLALAAPLIAAASLEGLGLSAPLAWAPGPAVLITAGVALALIAAAPWAAAVRADLRHLVLTIWLGSFLVALLFVAGPGGPFGGSWGASATGVLLGVAIFAAGEAAGSRLAAGAQRAITGLGLFWGTATLAFALHRLGEAAMALACFAAARARRTLWHLLLRGSERLANSWREWRWGRVRFIGHGVLGALATGAGGAYAAVLMGPGHVLVVVGATASAIVGSVIWAQLIEGSPVLSRPYGFFGGLLGVVLFAVLAAPAVLGTPTWLLLGAYSVAGPVIQALGRLRCLANGCCHGAPCAPEHGIRYTHPRTRVVRFTSFTGQPIYPTQLWSVLANVATGGVMARLWAAQAPLALLSGVYLILMGSARFVEEAYRGEPQTPIYAGLRLYQWLALASVLVGAVLAGVPGTPESPAPSATPGALVAGLSCAAITFVALVVDFPTSSRRFSRLA